MIALMPDDWVIRAGLATFAILLAWGVLVVLALAAIERALDRRRARRAARGRPA